MNRILSLAGALAGAALLMGAAPPRLVPEGAREGEPHQLVVSVDVLDDDGRPAPSLDATRWSATVDGRPGRVVDVTTTGMARQGVATVLAVDVSGSMKGKPLLSARKAARGYADRSAPEDKTALVAFGAAAEVVASFSRSRAELGQAIDTLALQPQGGTHLFGGIHQALQHLASLKQPRRRLVVVLSDGCDAGGSFTLDDVVTEAKADGVPIFTVGFVASERSRGCLERLQVLSSRTGGRYRTARDAASMDLAYSTLQASLRERHLVTVDLPDPALWGDAREHTLHLSLSAPDWTAPRSAQVVYTSEPRVRPPVPVAAPEPGPSPQVADSGPAGKTQWQPWVLGGAVFVLIALLGIRWAMRSGPATDAGVPAPAGGSAPGPLIVALPKGPRAPAVTAPPPRVDEPPPPGPPESPAQGAVAPPPPAAADKRRTVVVDPDASPVTLDPGALLIIVDGSEKGREFRVPEAGLGVGTSADCDVVLLDPTVSHEHARFDWRTDKELVVLDTGSTNGTYLNGHKLLQPELLHGGDEVRVGRTVLRVATPREPGDTP